VPIRPGFVRELESHVEKSWDLAQAGDAVSNELWSPELRAFLDAVTLKSLFFSEDWVFIITDLVSSKISSLPCVVMRKVLQEDGTESIEPAPEHPLNQLLLQPNQWQDYSAWMYNTVVELTLMGNAIMWHAPRSGQILTLPTENITMDFDEHGRVTGYIVASVREDGSGLRELQGASSFDPKTIIHVRRPNPSSLLWGLSPFVPGRKSVLFNRYSSDYLNAFYLKQATPGLALSLDRTVNEDVALRQLRSFEVAHQGRKNMRRTLILPKGVTASPLTHSLSDQKLIDHINQNRETICSLLKVPKHELSLQTSGSLGSEEYKVALRNFWESTLKPTMRFISGALTKFFQSELGEGHFFKFDISDVEALKDDLKKKAETAAAMLAAGLSINEVRQEVWQKGPVEAVGSDTPYVLAQRASVTFSAPQPEQPAEEAQKALPTKRKIASTPRVESFRASMTKQLDEEEGRTIGELSEAAVELLVGMVEVALDVIESSDKSLVFMCRKDLPSRRTLSRRIERALAAEFEESWSSTIARTLTQSVDLGYNSQLSMVFNEEAVREIEVLRQRDADKRRASLTARGLDSFAYLSRTQTEKIMGEIEKGQADNESITSIMRRIADVLGTPGQLSGRAETIARTETLTAVSLGQAAAVENAKEVIPGLKKAWLTAGDDRVRDSHRELDGDVVDVDKNFDNGLRHPRDITSTDPAEVINCRCTLLLIPPGEKLELP